MIKITFYYYNIFYVTKIRVQSNKDKAFQEIRKLFFVKELILAFDFLFFHS